MINRHYCHCHGTARGESPKAQLWPDDISPKVIETYPSQLGIYTFILIFFEY